MKQLLLILLVFSFTEVCLAQPTVDGIIDDAQYTTLASYTGASNWSPNNQLGAIKYYTDGNRMYIGISGVIEQNWNKLLLLVNFSGYTGIPKDNPNAIPSGFNGFFQGLAGTQFGIETDYAFSWTCASGTPIYCDAQRYGASTAIQGGNIGSSDQSGNASTFVSTDVQNVLGGSTGGCVQAYRSDFNRTTNPDHGLEFSIDISAFAGVTNAQTVNFFVIIANSDGTWLSNQTLPDYYNTGLFNSDFGNHPNISWMQWNAQANQSHPEVNFATSPMKPLPVELSSFGADVTDRTVTLKWITATEINTTLFEVERMKTGKDWSKIGSVQAAGTSYSPKSYSVNDNKLPLGKYYYRLKMIDLDGSYKYSKTIDVSVALPTTFALNQNFPNPFNPATRIDYQLPVDGKVRLELYSLCGQQIAVLIDKVQTAGYYSLPINAAAYQLSSGMYLYRLQVIEMNRTNSFLQTKKMVYLK